MIAYLFAYMSSVQTINYKIVTVFYIKQVKLSASFATYEN